MSIPQHHNGKPLVHTWVYRAMDGAPLGMVGRYQNGSDQKDIVPFFRSSGSGFAAGIELDPRPLFGLDCLAKHPQNEAVFIPEGEKSATALQSIDLCAVTSLGGSQAASKADWTPLNGYESVFLLPDNDEPGEHYGQDVYRQIRALESPPAIKVLRLSDLPKAGDVVDWMQSFIHGWDGYKSLPEQVHDEIKDRLKNELKNAEPVPPEWGNKVSSIGSYPGTLKVIWAENPVEINEKLKPVMAFNKNLLPDNLMPWVKDISYRMQCPPDYVAVAAMVALSAIVGKKGLIHPKAKDDWTVCPNLWGLNIGRPSAMKTPAANEALRPLQRLEIAAKEAFEAAQALERAQDFINKEGRALAEKQAKALIKDGKFSEASQLLLENPEDTKTATRGRYLINDATIEKLGELLNENPNGLMLFRDEISGFLKTIDREDRSNDRAFYLEAFGGMGSYTFDRIGRGTIDIRSVCLAMLGNIQPGVLRPYLNQATNGASGDDGMIQRFQLMVWPDFTGWEHVDQWPDKAAKDEAFNVFNRLSEWQGWEAPARFSEEAQALFDRWFCALHDDIRADDIQPVIESHLGKYKSLIPSIAVLIHLADSNSAVISDKALSKALAWAEYLKSHADRVYSSSLDQVDANAKTILNRLEAGKLLDSFGTRDILRGGWTGLDSLEAIKAALARLCDYGWIQESRDRQAGAGRPSIRYLVHPRILPKPT